MLVSVCFLNAKKTRNATIRVSLMKDTKKPDVFLACSTYSTAGSGQRKERDIKVLFITGCCNMEHKLLATDIKLSATKAPLC